MEFEPLIEKRRERLKELEVVMSAEDFYSDTKRVAEVSREYNQNKQLLEDWEKFSNARRQLKENHDLVFYSFRHRWSTLSHSDYFMSVEESSSFMGHKPETHLKNYSHILKGQQLDDVSERAKKRRRREKESE